MHERPSLRCLRATFLPCAQTECASLTTLSSGMGAGMSALRDAQRYYTGKRLETSRVPPLGVDERAHAIAVRLVHSAATNSASRFLPRGLPDRPFRKCLPAGSPEPTWYSPSVSEKCPPQFLARRFLPSPLRRPGCRSYSRYVLYYQF